MDWNRHFVKGPGIGVAVLAVGISLGLSACSHGKGSIAAAAATTSASSSPVTAPTTSASTTSAAPSPVPPATTAAPVPTDTSNGNGGAGSNGGGSGNVPQDSVLDDCSGHPYVEPTSYTPVCADDNFVLNDIQWTTYTAQQASGNATAAINDCNPTCAAGTTKDYPVYIEFDGQATDPADQTLQTYITLTVSFTGEIPPGDQPSVNFQVGQS